MILASPCSLFMFVFCPFPTQIDCKVEKHPVIIRPNQNRSLSTAQVCCREIKAGCKVPMHAHVFLALLFFFFCFANDLIKPHLRASEKKAEGFKVCPCEKHRQKFLLD